VGSGAAWPVSFKGWRNEKKWPYTGWPSEIVSTDEGQVGGQEKSGGWKKVKVSLSLLEASLRNETMS
jgi:hypothetical protein